MTLATSMLPYARRISNGDNNVSSTSACPFFERAIFLITCMALDSSLTASEWFIFPGAGDLKPDASGREKLREKRRHRRFDESHGRHDRLIRPTRGLRTGRIQTGKTKIRS